MSEKIGEYIYMGMGNVNGHRVCMSVAYKLDYSVKKALQFEAALNKFTDNASLDFVYFEKVNKVKVGCLEAETSFTRAELAEYVYKFEYGN